MPDGMTPENTQKPEAPQFKPSWLINSEEEFKNLREGKLGTVGKKIAMLHQTGIANTLNTDQLSDRAAKWGEEAVEEGDEIWPELTPYLSRMTHRIETMVQTTRPTPALSSSSELLEEIRDLHKQAAQHQEKQMEYQEEQVRLMMKGYKGFIQGIKARAHVNPEQYDQSLPPWFERLTDKEQAIMRNVLHINYIASVKRDQGDAWLGELKGLRIEKDALENMKRSMPGFREAFVTMFKDIFKQEGDHLVILGTKGDRKNNIAPTGGYAILESETSLKNYKIVKTRQLESFLMKNETHVRYAEDKHVLIQDVAAVAVSTVDNFFFGTGAYESGDEIRALSAGDADICTAAVRTFFMPAIQGESKWLIAKTPEEIEKKRTEQGIGDEDFGGILGAWVRENATLNRDGFRDKLRNDQIRLIPDRLFYSLMDHERFKEVPGLAYADQTITQVLINAPKIQVAQGVWDFATGNNAIDFSQLAATEILGDYSDTRGAAIKIFKHITASKQEDILKPDVLINALIKARKDTMINKIFRDEDLITACVVNFPEPPGLMRGISEMVLNIPDNIYDVVVYNVLLDPRLFDGMASDFRKRLFQRIHAVDLSDNTFISTLTRLGRGGVIDERRKLREKAVRNLAQGK